MRPRNRGASLVELAVGVAIFMLLSLLMVAALKTGNQVWTRSMASSSGQAELRKAYSSLSSDLRRSRFDRVARRTVPASLGGGGFDGDAIWFLTCEDPNTGLVMKKADGSPFWQRNILYYTIVPTGHNALYGFTCGGGADADGYDDRCPHKMLIRQVIDLPPATNPADETTEEPLLTAAQVAPYLIAPVGFDVSGIAGPGTEQVEVRAHSLLCFKTALAPDANFPGEVLVDLRAARIQEARRAVQVGSAQLDGYDISLEFSVFPAPAPPAP